MLKILIMWCALFLNIVETGKYKLKQRSKIDFNLRGIQSDE